MKKITVKEIMSWSPCSEYTELRVKELIGRGKTPLEICDLKIPAEDRFWVVLRNEVIPENDLHELACKFAEQALRAERKAGRDPHPDSWKIIKVKRRWLKGKATDEQLSAARSATWSAAWSDAGSAAWSAAGSAARSAAGSAVWLAARSAAGSAVWERQINIVKKYLREAEK